jgi:hypothetical protein
MKMSDPAATIGLVDVLVDREELAWAAGFFDGEGCFSYSEAGQYVCISITQSERHPLDRFCEAVGTGKVHGPYRQHQRDRWSKKPQYVFRSNGHDAVQAICCHVVVQARTDEAPSSLDSAEARSKMPPGPPKGQRPQGMRSLSSCILAIAS